MRIAIDGQLINREKTGMGVYTFNILKYWKETSCDIVNIYIPGSASDEIKRISVEKGFIIREIRETNYFLWEQIVLPWIVARDKMDVLWCPYCTAPIFSPCPFSVVVHDTIYMETKINNAPTLYKRMGILYRKLVVPRVIKRATTIATVSLYSKKQIGKHFPNVRDKVQVIPNGIDHLKSLDNEAKEMFFRDLEISGKYILGFGSLEKRKNTLCTIKAYEMLNESIKKEHKLVLFGFRGFDKSIEKKYIESHNLCGRIIILGYVSDSEKKCLYENCSLFVFPSLSEGFGIPVLEAFDSGTPVITSNTTALPEIAGKGAIFVDPLNPQSVSEQIERVINHPELAFDLINSAKSQIEKYDWKTSSERIKMLLYSSSSSEKDVSKDEIYS